MENKCCCLEYEAGKLGEAQMEFHDETTNLPLNINTTTSNMPPRMNFYGASRSLVIRSRPSLASRQPRIAQVVARRTYADEKGPTSPEGAMPHVSEEAAQIADVTGKTKPDLGQGTPVQEVCVNLNCSRDTQNTKPPWMSTS